MAGVFRFVTTLPLLPPKHSKTPKRVYTHTKRECMSRTRRGVKRVVTVVTKPYKLTVAGIKGVSTRLKNVVTEWKQWKQCEVEA